MFAIDLGKYKSILLSVALFLLLDASVLILNFYISFEIADDAVSINLAGRQRMLSQRMTKSLLNVDYSYENIEQKKTALKELRLSRDLFDETLTAFDLGGMATGAGGNTVDLNQAKDAVSLLAIKEGKIIWQEYKKRIDRVLEHQNDSVSIFSIPSAVSPMERNDLNEAIRFGRENNLRLLTLMNDLTVSLENVAASKAQRLRLIQTAGILMALVNFFIILFHFIRQLNEGDKVIESARKETIEILSTVSEGLFLIDNNFNIGSQRSESLFTIMNIDNHEEYNLESLLHDIISEKDIETTQGFLRLLFNPEIKEKLIQGLNPLSKIQVNLDNGDGNYQSKYLSFEFKRVIKNREIKDILVTVNDITENVILENKLVEEKIKNESQMKMLTSILQCNPDLINAFIKNSFKCFSNINTSLKRTAKDHHEFLQKTHDIYSEIHGFKGEAGALEMTELVNIAHEFEDHLNKIKQLKKIRGQDFLPLTVLLDKLIHYSQSITELMEKLSRFDEVDHTSNNHQNIAANSEYSWDHLTKLSDNLSRQYNKDVMLVMSGFKEAELSESLRDTINSLAIQFIRNAIVHGIELPSERRDMQKTPSGRIDLLLSRTPDNHVELIIKDDGSGIDTHKIIDRAVKSGEWTQEQLEHWDSKRLLSLIFEPGFSTADTIDHHAGRGAGMGVILKKVKQYRGKIRVHSRPGHYSQFKISFPLSIANRIQVA